MMRLKVDEMSVMLRDNYVHPAHTYPFTLSTTLSYLHPNNQSKQPISQSRLFVTNPMREKLNSPQRHAICRVSCLAARWLHETSRVWT